MTSGNSYIFGAIAVTALLASPAAFSASKSQIDSRVARALERFDRINTAHEGLEKKAVGELVFPKITKAGIGVGGEYGEGALLVGGQTVAYYSVSSASVGLTLGVAKHSEVILFNTQAALDEFRNSHGWSVGADVGVAVPSKGAAKDYDTQTVDKPDVAFVFGERGLIADASVEGSKINKLER
jgi:lipid-binding SYLF domain-containing protein